MTDHNDSPEFRLLAGKFIGNTCSREELDLFFRLLDDEHNKAELAVILRELWEKDPVNKEEDKADWDTSFEQMFRNADYTAPVFDLTDRKRTKRRIVWSAAAAAVILFCLIGYVEFRSNRPDRHQVVNTGTHTHKINDIHPGRNIAVLTLSDGSTIILDSVKNGPLAQEGNTKVIKMANGQLSYKPDHEEAGKTVYNTISTPKGGQYEIALADGTRVWLNAGSSLKFPTVFTGKNRTVSLTGEGYFEVAKNSSMPFKVLVGDMKVDVLGTHFNVNAYRDEDMIATTLLEGAVKVSTEAKQKMPQSQILKEAGQQANFDKAGSIKLTENVDIEEAISWKNGKFFFNNADISVMMRQIARWYDVEIKYEGAVPQRKFTGKIDRDVNVSQIITMLEYAKVHVKLDGNTIVVAP